MKSASRVLVFSAVCVVSCGDRDLGSRVSAAVPEGSVRRLVPQGYVVPMPIPADEERLIRRIVAHYRGSDASAIEKMLRDNPNSEVTTSNRAFQPHFDSLSAARRDRAFTLQRSLKASLDSLRASLVMVDQLEDPEAVAIVERRSNAVRPDIITLTGRTATPEHLRAALRALVDLRRAKKSPGAVGSRVVVRAQRKADRWDELQRELALSDLARLKLQPLSNIPGVGRGRRIEIFVVK